MCMLHIIPKTSYFNPCIYAYHLVTLNTIKRQIFGSNHVAISYFCDWVYPFGLRGIEVCKLVFHAIVRVDWAENNYTATRLLYFFNGTVFACMAQIETTSVRISYFKLLSLVSSFSPFKLIHKEGNILQCSLWATFSFLK